MRRVLNYLLAICFVLTIMVPNIGIIVHKLASTLFLVLALIHVFLYRNWIIEIKKKFKNYINNFSWFLLHAEKP